VAIVITGHTCSIGTDSYNQSLSVRRAEAVRNYLVARGLRPDRIRVEGEGERAPQYSNATEAERSKNRRTDFAVRVLSTGPLAGAQ
jgi:OOP family OmpA-OmpF porin